MNQVKFCPDVVDQGTEEATAGSLADGLRQSDVWYLSLIHIFGSLIYLIKTPVYEMIKIGLVNCNSSAMHLLARCYG